jgi:hypothetical protein
MRFTRAERSAECKSMHADEARLLGKRLLCESVILF